MHLCALMLRPSTSIVKSKRNSEASKEPNLERRALSSPEWVLHSSSRCFADSASILACLFRSSTCFRITAILRSASDPSWLEHILQIQLPNPGLLSCRLHLVQRAEFSLTILQTSGFSTQCSLLSDLVRQTRPQIITGVEGMNFSRATALF